MEPKRGGLRKGAGRKPTDNPKSTITLYVEKKKIWHFGNEEKLKVKVYDFINNAVLAATDGEISNLNGGATTITQKQETGFKSPPNAPDEPLSFEKMKNEAVKKVSQYDAYITEINEATELSQFPGIVKEIENDLSLTPQQRIKLKMIAVERSKTFDF